MNQQVYFAIAGDGPMKNDLLSLRDQLGLNDIVHLLGIRYDIPDLLSAEIRFLTESFAII